MSTALAIRTEGMEPRDLAEAREFSKLVASSALLPQSLRGRPEDVFVIVVSGHELGLSPMQAIRSISVIQGKPVLDAALMVALVKRQRDVCEYFTMVESTPQRATYETKRAGEPAPTRMTFTIEEAKAAGLANKDNWQKHTAAMLRARASSALARAVYPDLVLGVYETDEGEEMQRGAAPVRMVRPAAPVEDAVVEEHPAVAMAQATFEGAHVATPAPSFEELNDRLHKLPGYAGDEGKAARKEWWAGALGYVKPGPKWSPFTPYSKADDATKARVVADLAKLEEAAKDDDDVPEFHREPGSDDE